jgi:hypothetical protein
LGNRRVEPNDAPARFSGKSFSIFSEPIKLEFIIYLNVAKQIGFTILPNVLASADKVIK